MPENTHLETPHEPTSTVPPLPATPPTAGKPTPASLLARLNKPLLLAAGAGLVIGAMLGIAGTVITTNAVNEANAAAAAKAEAEKPRPLKDAATSCDVLGADSGAKLGDNDTSLSLDGKGDEDYSGLPMDKITCVLSAIHIPDFVRSEMDGTRALDGTQRESWENFNATWSYHPNTGLNVGLTEKK